MEKHSQSESTALKHSLSNEKRLESLKLKSQQNKQQKNVIKFALAEVDSGKSVNKRIVFRSDDEDEVPDDKISNHLGHSSNEKSKRQLFDDSDSNCEESLSGKNNNLDDVFSIKPQFEGKKGQELLALQARFKNDERFQLDERFLDNEEDEESSAEGEDKTTEGMDINAEREKNFEILQEVLGFQFPTQSPEKKIEKYRTVKDSSKLRYDPTREDAQNFEIKRESKEQSSSKKGKQKAADPEPVILPEVSKERFFNVATNLKEAFTDNSKNKTFSFLKEFSSNSSDRKDNNNDDYFTEPIVQPKHSSFQKNAFKYDSSDNEDEGASQFLPLKKISEQKKHQEQNSSKPEWKFFFSPNDPRLKEGVQYFKKGGTDEEIEEWWKKTRSAMLDLIQVKRKVSKCKTTMNKRRGKRGK